MYILTWGIPTLQLCLFAVFDKLITRLPANQTSYVALMVTIQKFY